MNCWPTRQRSQTNLENAMLTRKQHELLLLIHERLQAEGVPPSFEEMKEALALKSKSGIHRLITALEERGFIRRLPNRARALEVIKLPDGFEDAGPGVRQATPSANPARGMGGGGFMPSVIKGGADGSSETGGNVTRFPGAGAPARSGGLAARYGGGAGSPASGNGQGSSSTRGGFSESGAAGGYEVPVMGRIAAGVPIAAIQEITHMIAMPPDMIGMGKHYALEVQGDLMIEAGILDGDTVIIRETSSAELGDIVVALVDDEEATLKRFRRQDGKIALEAANPAYETRILTADRVKVQGKLAGLVRKY